MKGIRVTLKIDDSNDNIILLWRHIFFIIIYVDVSTPEDYANLEVLNWAYPEIIRIGNMTSHMLRTTIFRPFP